MEAGDLFDGLANQERRWKEHFSLFTCRSGALIWQIPARNGNLREPVQWPRRYGNLCVVTEFRAMLTIQKSSLPLPAAPRWAATRPAGSPLSAALLQELRAVVGEENLVCAGEERRHWARTTLSQGTLPAAIARPGSVGEVQSLVRLANRRQLALYPLSTGRNWGYGDACAPSDGQVLLDLSRLDRILEVNEEFCYARIEPGVTQGRLAAHLETQGGRLWMDATGAGPETSIIGNTLERGFGHTPHGDRIAHACNLEVVLPNGQLFHTGFGHFAGARAANHYPYGVGPAVDGLFTQSNLGIVTKMTVWLMPKPEAFQAFFFSLGGAKDIAGLIEALRPLRLAGTLRTPIHIFNDLRLLGATARYPWGQLDGREAVGGALREELCRRHGLQAWSGSGALYGGQEEVAGAARAVRRALRGVPGLKWLVFIDERRLSIAKRAAGWCRRLGLKPSLARVFDKLELGYGLLRGRPDSRTLQGNLWRVRTGAARPGAGPEDSRSGPDQADPRTLGAGFYWVAPVVPLSGREVEAVNRLAEEILRRHGFEYQVTLSLVTPRAACAIISITYDREREEERARARRCHDELGARLLREGYPPYRAGLHTVPLLGAESTGFYNVIATLKNSLDPSRILAPGRYEPAAERPSHGS